MSKLVIMPRRESVAIVADFIKAFALLSQLNKRSAYRLRAVCEEIVTNIIDHGCNLDVRCGLVQVQAEFTATAVYLTVMDDGKPFDMSQVPVPPNLSLAPHLRDVGGLGIYLVKNLSDSFTYQRKYGKNIHKLTILLPVDSKQAS